MKKSLVLTFILLGIALLSFPAALVMVDCGKERIVITEEVLSGDPEAAAGITLKIPVHYDRQLLWDTEYTIGSGRGAESVFSFSSRQVTWGWVSERKAGLWLESGVRVGSALMGFTGNPAASNDVNYVPVNLENIVFSEAVRAVVERTGDGESHSEIIRVGDYYAYNPVIFETEGGSVTYEGNYDEACDYLTEFFHISVAEDRVEITVEKSNTGEIISVRIRKVPEDEAVVAVSASAFGSDGMYYVYLLENTRTGDFADRGQNRGIFFFPYEWEADRDLIRLDLTRVRKAGEFPGDVYPIQMLLDEDESLMYLAVKEKEGYGLYIYALERETPVLLQQIPVNRSNLSGNMEYLAQAADSSPEEEKDGSVLLPYFCRMSLEDGGILMTWSDNSFSFVAREDGRYRWWCDGMFPESREYEEAPFPIENVCAFDGKRLVLAAYENWYSLNVLTAVYDEQGQKYVGLYRHSEENDIDEGLGIYSKVMPQGTREKPFMYSTYGGSIWDKIVKPLEIMIEKQ